MQELDKNYLTELQNISGGIQNSDLLAQYLDTEEEEVYKALTEEFEPRIHELYLKVANNNPLQIESFENELLNPEFEGLYLPKVLGYSVLRGEINDQYKYIKPQNHFKDVLMAICNSANFDLIKLRIGQTVQVGFFLSSDIWITNFMDQVTNKKVLNFLESLMSDRFRVETNRELAYNKYKIQFNSFNYQSAEFPANPAELKSKAKSLKSFLIHRAGDDYNNDALMGHIGRFINNSSLYAEDSYLELLMIIGMMFDLKGDLRGNYTKAFDEVRAKNKGIQQDFFTILVDLHADENIKMHPEYDNHLSKLVTRNKDEISKYFELMDVIHGKGYIHQDSIDATQKYVDQHEGLSPQNKCVRETILTYFEKFMNNLEPSDYPEYFEINKTFVLYMNIFYNQRFNQAVKDMSLRYIKKLLKTYTDKRGRDYQDIKKFVTATFLDMNFMNEKEIAELFKTRRVKKVSK
ncbi:MAG TPA: hypothetical protein PK246_02495 [Saprospiraceae bacterium]|nr:hypothetical protein [Saprospiraceae bacterium]